MAQKMLTNNMNKAAFRTYINDNFEEVYTQYNNIVNEMKELQNTGVDTIARDQIADIIKQGVSCSLLGMTPNDETKASDNFAKLVDAMQAGYKILIDDKYYISAPYTRPVINKGICWEGINGKSEFVLYGNSSYLFDIGVNCDNILIDNLSFSNVNIGSPILFYVSKKVQYVNSIVIKNIRINGNISFMRFSLPTDVNPEETNYGIGYFELSNSIIKNVRLTCFVFTDCPCEQWHIYNNEINNFDYIFFSCGITNDIPYSKEVFEKCKLFNIHDNYVHNDDDWWGSGDNGTYFCAFLFEGKEVKYYNNHIEGIHTTYKMATYDAYLSAENIYYHDNIWKNNICFNVNKENNTLMKAKGSGTSDVSIKRYCNNHYMIEKSYAEKLGQDPSLLKVDWYQSTSRSQRWEIKNNTIDVYSLIGHTSSILAEEMWVLNNEISCEYFSDITSIINYRVVHDAEAIVSYDYSKVIHKICNNTITVKNGKFSLIKCGSDLTNGQEVVYPSVEIKNNYLELNNPSYLTYSLCVNNLNIQNNTVIINGTDTSVNAWGYNNKVQGIYNNINNTIIKNSGIFRLHGYNVDGYILNENYNIQDVGSQKEDDCIRLPENVVMDVKYRYNKRYKILCADGALDFNLVFDIYYDPITEYNYIAFTNISDAFETYKICKSTDVGNGEGNWQYIKLTGEYGTYKMQFANKPTGRLLYFTNWGAESKTTQVITTTRIIGKFLINSSNDVLVFNSDLGTATLDIPDGAYTGYTLASAIQTAMNANTTLTGNGAIIFTVTWDIHNQKFTIDAGEGHTIAYTHSGSDLGTILGFTENISSAQSITSQVACG